MCVVDKLKMSCNMHEKTKQRNPFFKNRKTPAQPMDKNKKRTIKEKSGR